MSQSESKPVKQASGVMKFLLEQGPLLVLLAGVILLKGKSFDLLGAERTGFVVMTLVFVPLAALATAVQYALYREVSRGQVITLAMVIVFGGLTFWLNDERFLKVKVTLIYLIFALFLSLSLVRGRAGLESLLGSAIEMREEGWIILTRRFALLFLFYAALNEIVWRVMSTEFWLGMKIFGFMGATMVFFITQLPMMRAHGAFPPEDENKG